MNNDVNELKQKIEELKRENDNLWHEAPDGFMWYSQSEKEEESFYCQIQENNKKISQLNDMIKKIEENSKHEGQKLFAEGLNAAKKKDYENARKSYEAATKYKNSGAMNNLGVIYLHGYGVEKSYNKAFELFLESAKLGNAVAMRNVGDCYRDGRGTNKNIVEFLNWHTKGTEAGDARCMFSLGEYYGGKTEHQDVEKAVKYYNEAAKNGNSKMKLEVAKKLDMQPYYDGPEALDLAKASYWFKETLNGDDDEIKFNAAKEMEDKYNASGVLIRPAIDLSLIFNAYKSAAEAGNKEACKEVAYCFEIGKGTVKSIDSAIMFYEKGGYNERAEWCKKKKNGHLSDEEFEKHMGYKMPEISLNEHASNKELYNKNVDFAFGQYKDSMFYINNEKYLCSSNLEGKDIKKLVELDDDFISNTVFLQVNATGIYLYSTYDYPKFRLRKYNFDGKLENEYYANKDKEYNDSEWYSNVYVYDSNVYCVHNKDNEKPIVECINMEDLSVKSIYDKASEIEKLYAYKEHAIIYAKIENADNDDLYEYGWLDINISSLKIECLSHPYCSIENIIDNPEFYDSDSKKYNEKCYFNRHIQYIDLNRKIMWTRRIVKEGVDSNHLKDVIYLEPKELFGDKDKVIENLPIWKITDGFSSSNPEYFDGRYLFRAESYYILVSMDLMGNRYLISGDNGGHGKCEEFSVIGNYMYVDRAANYYLEQCKLGVDKLEVVKKVWFND